MKAETMLNKIKVALGMEVKLETMTLDNGTVIEAASFEAGQEVFIVGETENVPLPVGEYTLDNGQMLIVTEEGIIGEVKDAAPEADPNAETEMADTITRVEFEELKAVVLAMAEQLKASTQMAEQKLSEEKEVVIDAAKEEVVLTESFKHSPEKGKEQRAPETPLEKFRAIKQGIKNLN